MDDSKRVPAFWRVKSKPGVYLRVENSMGGYWGPIEDAKRWRTKPAPINCCGGHVVPVYVTVRKVKRGHDFGWALKRMREGKRVRWETWPLGEWVRSNAGYIVDEREKIFTPSSCVLLGDNWELAE